MKTVTFLSNRPLLPTSFNERPANALATPNSGLATVGAPVSLTTASQVTAISKPSPVKFGIIHPYCGVCPICVAGAAAQKELDTIRQLKDAKNGDDISISEGQAMAEIRKAGKETGAAVESTNIGHEDGSRLQPVALPDLDAFNVAALPRIYDPDGKTYTINVNPMKLGGGTENGLFKKLIGGVVSAEKTYSYDASEDAAPPPIEGKLLNSLDKSVRSLGLYHHISEGLEVRTTALSKPLLVGYASVAKLQPHELFVPSIRPLPGFEGGGVPGGALMNAMGMAVKNKGYNAVVVMVEPWQKELKDYINVLKNQYGYDVQEMAPKDTPAAYMDFKSDLGLPNSTELFRISLKPLKKAYEEIDAKLPDGDRDTQLAQTIALPDPGKDAFHEKVKNGGGPVIDCFKNPVSLKDIHLDRIVPRMADLLDPKVGQHLDYEG